MPIIPFTVSDGEIIIGQDKLKSSSLVTQIAIASETDSSTGTFDIFSRQMSTFDPPYASIENDGVPVSIDATKLATANGDGAGQIILFEGFIQSIKIVANGVNVGEVPIVQISIRQSP
jgi:hypothetical protein